MSRAAVADGQAVLHGHGLAAGIGDLDEQLIALHAAVQRDGAALRRQLLYGAEGVFQPVAQQRAQLRVGDGQRVRQPRLHCEDGALPLRLVGIG